MTQFDQKNSHLDKMNTHAGDSLNSEIVAKVAWTQLCACVHKHTRLTKAAKPVFCRESHQAIGGTVSQLLGLHLGLQP